MTIDGVVLALLLWCAFMMGVVAALTWVAVCSNNHSWDSAHEVYRREHRDLWK